MSTNVLDPATATATKSERRRTKSKGGRKSAKNAKLHWFTGFCRVHKKGSPPAKIASIHFYSPGKSMRGF